LERPNSSKNASNVPLLCLSARQSVTSCRAWLSICSRVLLERGLLCSSWVTAWCSSWWVVGADSVAELGLVHNAGYRFKLIYIWHYWLLGAIFVSIISYLIVVNAFKVDLSE
jgi:hypothetical protein